MAPILESRKKHSATVMTDEVQAVIAKDPAERTPLEQQVYHIAETRFGGLGDPVRSLRGDDAKRYAELKAQLASVRFHQARAAARRPVHEGSERHRAAHLYIAWRQPLSPRR